ncbi:conserved hypothetical protein [Candida dubliniensis CD36]|uniref:Uncharacterized protein n=1 Tax=Candida dubliniensis (strain CD36 / ATCC MYA-646 / CBS 7987 / NCPF 3949 / NRRL Y-17841) TaxID=573826 RepID=B9WG01_CANDC|nr:conserved hypothetical protein [Candida dubliniensis CD36]CAX42170.1 conserved hypothetical protein [Candida dubliniensis CD36]
MSSRSNSPSKTLTESIEKSFSPIKINLTTTDDSPNKSIIHHKTPQRIIYHPHGLSAKHEARRNTIGYSNSIKRRGLVHTPLIPPGSIRNPITSPRLAVRPPINLESIKRTNQKMAQQIKLAFPANNDDDKENELHLDLSSDPDEDYSSPIKRHTRPRNDDDDDDDNENSGHLSKIPKLAEPNEEKQRFPETVVNDDEEIESVEENNRSNLANEEQNDNDSDNEDITKESHGSVMYQQNQTLDNTQINKIIREDLKLDYITPERATEAVAQSPHPHHQHIRLIEEDKTEDFGKFNDTTSPLKKRNQDENEFDDETANLTLVRQLENEPTINFLMSPNSKPVFSKDQVNKIQKEHDAKVDTLLQELNSRDDKIKELYDELAKVNEQLISSQKEQRALKDEKSKLANSENLLTIQLQHNERELASLTKNFRLKESSLNNLKRKLNEQKISIDETRHENDTLKSKINELQVLERDLKAEIVETSNSNIESTLKLDQVIKEKEELWIKNQELNEKLQSSESTSSSKYDKLKDEYEDLQKENQDLVRNNKRLEADKLELEDKTKKLETVNQKLKDDNINNENLIKEYEKVATSRIEELESERDSTIEEISKYKQIVHDLETQVEKLKSQYDEKENTNKELELRIQELESKSVSDDELQELKRKLEAKDKDMESKEKTIEDYLSKMDDLVGHIKPLKKENEELKQDQQRLTQEVTSLKDKLEKSKIQADEDLDKLSKYLYAEYAAKHIKKLEGIIKENKKLERELEFYKMKLEKANKDAELLSERNVSSSALSPKITAAPKNRGKH